VETHKLDGVNRSGGPDDFGCDEAAVNHGLRRAVGAVDQVFLYEFGTAFVVIQVKHVKHVVNRAAN